MSKFLIVRLGDNDFYNSLQALGKWILEEIDEDTVTYMIEEGSMGEILTQMFRSMLCLQQQRFDMYKNYGNKEEVFTACRHYMEDNYYNIKNENISLVSDWVPEWENSEVLVVNYGNRQIHIV
ncbi:hypothetical protein VPHF99_0002 [Vibrio phage F99]